MFDRRGVGNAPWTRRFRCCSSQLILHGAAARANCQLRVVRPELTSAHAQGHDDGVRKCLCQILHIDPAAVHTRQLATLPLSLGGLGLRSATRTEQSAYWPSWADSWACSTTDTAMRQTHSWSVSLLVQDHRLWLLPIRLVKSCPVSWVSSHPLGMLSCTDEFEPGSCRTGWQRQ